MAVLKAENLIKIYGKGENQVKALNGVSLSVEKGEFVAVWELPDRGSPLCSICWEVWTGRIREKLT